MVVGYKNQQNVNWDDLFEPRETGDPTVDPTGYTVYDDEDAADRYAPLSVGLRITGDTGFTIADGTTDVADLFAAKGSRGAGLAIVMPQTATFSCSTSGSSCTASGTITAQALGGVGPYTYAWTKVSGDGSITGGADTDTVTVQFSVNSDDGSGVYRCTITDSESPTPVQVDADCAVTFDYQYVNDLAITIPGSASGSCSTSGSSCTAHATVTATATGGQPPYQYIWHVASGPGSISDGLHSQTATISDSVPDSGPTVVFCNVKDSTDFEVSSNNCTVTLTYNYINDLTASVPISAVGDCYTEGNSCTAAASIHCTVNNGYPPYSYQWAVTSGSAHIQSGGAQSTVVVAQTLGDNETSHVHCVVTDSQGYQSTSNSCAVTLRYHHQNNLQATVPATEQCSCTTSGSSCTAKTTITCTVSGGQSPFTYSWSIVSGQGSIESGGSTATVHVADNVSSQDVTVYRCKVTDNLGNQSTSNNCSVTFTYQYDQGGCCFLAGTKVAMADGGYKLIEDIAIGDDIIGWDGVNNAVTKVKGRECPVRDHHCVVRMSDGAVLRMTDEHPMYTRGGWKSINPERTLAENPDLVVGLLREGDELLSCHGEYVDIVSIERIPGEVQTYNLKWASPLHNFFAGGFLAHNKGGCVALDMWLEPSVLARDAIIGEEYDCVTYRGRRRPKIEHRKITNHFGITKRPAVFIVTQNLCALKLSADTPVNISGATEQYGHAHWRRASATLNERVVTSIDGPIRYSIRNFADRWFPPLIARAISWLCRPWLRWSRVIAVLDAGQCEVAHLSYGGRSYLAGYKRWRRIATHNIIDPKQ